MHGTGRSWWRGSILVLASVGVLSLSGCCSWFCPVATKPRATIVIEDPEMAAWMTVTNTFTLAPNTYFSNPSKELWDGVLFQLGDSEVPPQTLPLTLEIQIEITPQSGEPIIYPLTEVTWVNVQAVDPARVDPMTAGQAGLLWPDPSAPSLCTELDGFADRPALCDSANLPCNKVTDLKVVPGRCLRHKSLHAYLKPVGILTYWTGPKGYEFAFGTDRHIPRQVFKLLDAVNVTVLKKVDSTTIDYKDARRVRLFPKFVPTHTRKHDPGGNG